MKVKHPEIPDYNDHEAMKKVREGVKKLAAIHNARMVRMFEMLDRMDESIEKNPPPIKYSIAV